MTDRYEIDKAELASILHDVADALADCGKAAQHSSEVLDELIVILRRIENKLDALRDQR